MRRTWITGLPSLLAASVGLSAEPQAAARPAEAAAEWSWLAIAATVIGVTAALVLIWAVRRIYFRREPGPRNDPRHLLHELCQAHGLSRRAERLLRKAAAALGTPHPGRFFLEPKLLMEAQKCEQLGRSRRALGLLYDRLFGEDLS